MTLTTERLKQLADPNMICKCSWDEYKSMAAELLANREAQPVAYIADCGTIVSESDPFFDDYKHPQPLYTAPPAPVYPERLPCPVHLLPGLKFGKGVPTRSMLDALVRRADYEAELDAMTPEQKAEDNARIEAFKELLPKPTASAVPDNLAAAVNRLLDCDGTRGHFSTIRCSDAREEVERLLAQPVSQGYTLPDGWKLVPVEPTEDMIAAAMNCDDVSFNADETFCVNFGNIYAAMLAAAPEGGNDHDTRR